MTDLLIWLDLETSGLDHTEDALLEIGAVATGLDLVPVAEFAAVARLPYIWDPHLPESWPVDPTVRAMHEVSGLWADCRAATAALDEDDLVDAVLWWVRERARDHDADKVTLAGSGVATFDQPWLLSRMDPNLDWPFHYRVLDLSPVRTLLGMAGISDHLDTSSGPGKKHRALDDARAHLSEARMLIDLLTRMRRADQHIGAMVDMQDGPYANPPGGEL